MIEKCDSILYYLIRFSKMIHRGYFHVLVNFVNHIITLYLLFINLTLFFYFFRYCHEQIVIKKTAQATLN